MKKFISFFMCAVLIAASLCSCSAAKTKMTQENITKTVGIVETALKEFNTKDLEKYVDSSTLNVIMGYAKDHEQFTDLGKAIFENLKIEIVSVDEANATVTVNITNKDLYYTANSFAGELMADYSPLQLLGKLDDDTFLDVKLKKLCAQIDDCTLMPEPQEAVIKVEQGKKNLVLVFDEQSENAVSGGALTGIKSIYS